MLESGLMVAVKSSSSVTFDKVGSKNSSYSSSAEQILPMSTNTSWKIILGGTLD